MITQFQIMIGGLLGAITYKLLNYRNSGKKNTESPVKFSFTYWINDRGNWNDLILGAILFAVLAFYKEEIFLVYPDFWLVKWVSPFKDFWLFYFLLGTLMTFIIKIFRNIFWMFGELSKKAFKNKE